MSKKQLLLLTCVSTLALVGPTAFAEDVVPADPTAPSTEVVIPPTPVDPGVPTDTTDPSTPVEPETPTDTTTPTDSSTTPTDSSTTPGTSTKPSDSESTNTNPGTKPTDEVKPETPKTPEVPSTVTPGVIDKVDKETGNITIKPIPISPNKTIIGTQNGNVIVQDDSGSRLVSASELGGRLNEDGTVTIKDSEGKEKTLPHTGEEKGFLSIIGATILSFVAYLFKKKLSLK
ncbi:LPXTG cell wall anchor domain-containing protein [Streptococcus agalactiae]|uniref:LPXTG cell wall anchor domain-containing protein n=1 Tax=Streptococcus agalactiae TaxID=1311 RepID=UPI0002F0CB10|nr:LPXTG cell wall anchor domain-containing protein [Streptococcus agalactiae]HEN0360719.1 LPXTG cell wall anchor domain-containing protein [Streptococcus agalactiae]